MKPAKALLSLILVLAAGATAIVSTSSTTGVALPPTLTPAADALKCDLAHYKAAAGLTATLDQDLLVVSWTGQAGAELRARYAIDSAQPVIRDLAIRKSGGQWATLGQNLTPEYHVTTGIRRMSEQQA